MLNKSEAQSGVPGSARSIDRTVLPVPEPQYPPITELDVKNAQAPPRFQVKAPKGAPNVVVILLDNFGFGDASTFGGPIQMPTLDRFAETGLRYNNFKVPPLCSPSRVALLTGRNSHSANFGVISEIATAFPGYTAMRPASVTMLPEILRLNGYSTAMFGKCHELGPWESSVVGPFDRWPMYSGFERFYGFMAGEADLFHPVIYDNMNRADLHPGPDYYASTDITDKGIEWVRSQHSLAPDKPFFVYYSAIGTHGPFQVPENSRDKYKGKFDQGWDQVRKETLARQIKMGVVPPGTELAPKPWEPKARATFENDKWELYNVEEDFSCAHDLAAKYPDKLEKLKGVFLEEAVKYNVLPLDDRAWERFNAALAGRPDLLEGRTEMTVYEGMKGIPENGFINVKNRSFVVIADIEVPPAGAEGVVIAQGGEMGGWSLYVKDGAPRFAWNFLGREIYKIVGPARLPAGKVTLRFEFAYDGGRPGAGGNGSIFVNGQKVATGRIEHTQPFAFGAETTDVGENLYTCVSDDYKVGENRFTGKVNKVTVQVGKSNLSEEAQRAVAELRVKRAMAG